MSLAGVPENRIEKHIPEYRLRPRHHILPNLLRYNYGLLERTLSNNLTNLSGFLELFRYFARTR